MQAHGRLIVGLVLVVGCARVDEAPTPSADDPVAPADASAKSEAPEAEAEAPPEPAGPSAEAQAWVAAAEQVASAYGEGSDSCEEVATRLESASEALATLAGANDAVAVEVHADADLGPQLEAAMEVIVSGRLRCPP